MPHSFTGLTPSLSRFSSAAMLTSLDQVRADIHARLAKAAKSRKSPMHTPVVATTDADARVMVLRAWDREARTLRFHTDARSPKVAAMRADGRVGVLFYDAPQKVQIRCRGTASVEQEGARADAAWGAASAFARRCYMGAGPGSEAAEPTSGLPASVEGHEPTAQDLLPARENFAIVLVQVASADWLYLAHTGHRRARIDLTGNDDAGGSTWLTP